MVGGSLPREQVGEGCQIYNYQYDKPYCQAQTQPQALAGLSLAFYWIKHTTLNIFLGAKIVFSNQGSQVKMGRVLGILFISRLCLGVIKITVTFLILIREKYFYFI